MANMCLFVVYDRVAEESGPIFEAVNVGVALRKYREILKNSSVSPEEYQLLQIGTFDHATNKLVPFTPPESIALGVPADGLHDLNALNVVHFDEKAVNK